MDFLNIIIDNGNVRNDDADLIFGSPQHKEERIITLPPSTSMIDLLMMLGAFASRNQAKKNWKHGVEIPPGFSEFFIGKLRKHLTIWNPTEP